MAFPTLSVKDGNNVSQTINTTPNAGQNTMANSLGVVIASDQSSIPVTGTFYQTTQPVSIASSVPVTGTFWQTTQPVSVAASAIVDGADVTQGTKADTAYAGSGSASVISALKGVYNILAAPLPAGTNALGTVGVTGTVAVTQSGTWNTARSWTLSSSGDSVTIGGTLPAFANSPTVLIGQGSTNDTDISGSITTGGTAQQIQAATTTRIGFTIQNTSTSDLWFSERTSAVTASPSFRLPAGQTYQTPENWSPTGAISIIGSTTGQTFTARTW